MALILHKAAKHGDHVDPDVIEDILGVSREDAAMEENFILEQDDYLELPLKSTEREYPKGQHNGIQFTLTYFSFCKTGRTAILLFYNFS